VRIDKKGREKGGKTDLPPVPLALCIKAFQAKKGGREGLFEMSYPGKS